MADNHDVQRSAESTNLAELLERVLDTGVFMEGDISVRLFDVELLTIQLRLVVCSLDEAKERGLVWWNDRGRTRPSSAQRVTEEEGEWLEHRFTQMARSKGRSSASFPAETLEERDGVWGPVSTRRRKRNSRRG